MNLPDDEFIDDEFIDDELATADRGIESLRFQVSIVRR